MDGHIGVFVLHIFDEISVLLEILRYFPSDKGEQPNAITNLAAAIREFAGVTIIYSKKKGVHVFPVYGGDK